MRHAYTPSPDRGLGRPFRAGAGARHPGWSGSRQSAKLCIIGHGVYSNCFVFRLESKVRYRDREPVAGFPAPRCDAALSAKGSPCGKPTANGASPAGGSTGSVPRYCCWCIPNHPKYTRPSRPSSGTAGGPSSRSPCRGGRRRFARPSHGHLKSGMRLRTHRHGRAS